MKNFIAPTQILNTKRFNLRHLENFYASQELLFSLSSSKMLRFLSQGQALELSTIVLGAWALLLSRYSSSEEVILGIISFQPEFKSNAGKILPIRVKVRADQLLLPWLEELEIRRIELKDYEHPAPTQICELSEIPKGGNLFESLLVLDNDELRDKDLENQLLETIDYPLTLKVIEGQQLLLKLYYDTQRFDTDAITRLLGRMQTLLESMASNPQQSLGELPMLTSAERHQLLVEWNNTQVDYPCNKTIHQLFEDQVERTPDSIAVIFQERQLTYRELNNRANQLAHYLQKLGVKNDALVGICVERSLEMVVGLLGILKAGCAYVPLDPTYPQERLHFMLQDTQVSVLLTSKSLVTELPKFDTQLVLLDADWDKIEQEREENLVFEVSPESLGYVIYTSGSTGKPKGVQMTQIALCNLILWQLRNTSIFAQAKTLQFSPISFDVSFQEIFSTWYAGGTLVLIDEETRRDARALLRLLKEQAVERLFLPFVALQQLAEVAQFSGLVPDRLQDIITAGEQLQITPAITYLFTNLTNARLHNHYGPSESHVVTAFTLNGSVETWSPLPPIGRAIANTHIFILDSHLQPVPIGIPGELYIGGVCLARGYLNRPELTAEKFIPNPFSHEKVPYLYKTGDLVRYLRCGDIEYLGRIDNQVKIRGFRIELGEVESTLCQHPSVQTAVVIPREDIPGNKRLVAYIVPKLEQKPTINELRNFLKLKLASYMIPSSFIMMEVLPLTPSGKLDRRALPAPIAIGADANFIAPNTRKERVLAEIWCDVLSLEQVGIEDNFFDIGGTSLLVLQIVMRVQKQLGFEFRAVKLYQYPTIRTLAQYLDREEHKQVVHPQQQNNQRDRLLQKSPKVNSDGIAIIGMVGRFPGADTVEALWENLCNGIESCTTFTEAEIDPSVDIELRTDPNYVRVRGIVEGAETFDAGFFGISPREAEVMDPQARVFLELAYTALENAGYMPESYDGAIGLYAGSGQNTYFEHHICGRPEIINRLGEFQTMLANEKDFVTTRTSYKLGLTGPSLSINTACSTSLVAVIQAFQGLMSNQCDIALAGGISITTPQNRGYLYQEGSMLSPDGRCRPFDINAQGTMFNSGAGIVILKRLEEALDDGDRIYAVIKGVGINNDGTDKVSFTAPSVNGQAGAITMAQASAGIHPETISYIETHGTATPLGDPIEVEALTQAFRTQTDATQFCAIGSIKSNVGHLVAAAGVAGLIKTALALYYKKIPPSLNFESPNPEIDFANSPFYVNNKLVDWAAGETPRRAGVSSFGVGGTNAHVVLEEAPSVETSSPSRPFQLLRLSAKTSTALEQTTTNLKEYFTHNVETKLADVAYTLDRGRKAYNHRRFVVCSDRLDAISTLDSLDVNRSATRLSEIRNPDVVFMFPGQGSQYLNMGKYCYEHEIVFRDAVDRCAEILRPLIDRDLLQVIYPPQSKDGNHEAATALLRQTQYTQPALFTIEYALAQLWQSWGIRPAAMIGHSIGEFVAACLSGVFSLEDGLKLVATRARMMGALPSGSMLSVRLPAEALQKRLSDDLAIAAVNGASLCVVAGPTEVVNNLQQQLEAEEIVCRTLHTSHAFHSPMMDSIIEPFAEMVKTVQLSPPKIPFVSTVTTEWITDAQATDPMYWASHLRATVRFAEGAKKLWEQPERVLLEVGPRTTTATLARQQAKDIKRQIAISSLGSTADDYAEWAAILQAIGQLWLAGVDLDRQQFYADEYRHRIPLPTYPFERKRYWIDPKPAIAQTLPPPAEPIPIQPATETQSLPPIPSLQPNPTPNMEVQTHIMTEARKQQLIPQLQEVLETTSGLEIDSNDGKTTFLEMGLDSLSLTQVAMALKKKFKVKITFRHLLEDYPNLDTLSDFVLRSLPTDAFPAPAPIATPVEVVSTPASSDVPAAATPVATPTPISTYTPAMSNFVGHTANGNYNNGNVMPSLSPEMAGTMQSVVAQQLQIMAQQLQLLSQAGGTISPAIATPVVQTAPLSAPPTQPTPAAAPIKAELAAVPEAEEPKPRKNSGPGAKIEKSVTAALTTEQQKALDRIITRYIARTPESKRQTQEHRKYLADPRTVSGFTPLFKEMVYPIVTDRASGSKLWDVDGNEYVDITNGFGSNFFGWSPDFVTEAVKAQLDKGIEIGPQTPLAGKVAKLIAEFTGMERVAFCNTGSEAVMAALRLARTVTGRDLVATFAGDYHGTFDEVIYRQGPNLKTLPAAPGILPCMFENLLVLDYNTPESLQILHDRADDLAAILVEPVRSRDPNLQPKEFLQDLRHLTEQSGTAYILDEVVTGFRVHPGGAQAYFNIQADMATYGKVVGGGLPIGIVAGKAEYMDALDGGFWQYGDNSIPEIGVTFFAGTFVRHPMALAAAEAVLNKLKAGGPELQRSLADKVSKFATHLNQHFDRVEAPIKIAHFSSLFYITYPHELPYAQLLFYLLREKGVHVWDHRPCFFTLAHTNEDIELVIRAFKDSVAELQANGFLPGPSLEKVTNGNVKGNRNCPPRPGARLGRDPEGNPAWYIPDPDCIGKYLQVGGVT